MRLGQAFKILREKKGITVDQIADIKNREGETLIHRSTLYRWENGESEMTAEKIIEILEAMDCGIDFMDLMYIAEVRGGKRE